MWKNRASLNMDAVTKNPFLAWDIAGPEARTAVATPYVGQAPIAARTIVAIKEKYAVTTADVVPLGPTAVLKTGKTNVADINFLCSIPAYFVKV